MIFTNSDGGARGNPGKGAIGVIVRDDEKILEEYAEFIGDKVTNNFAEYKGILKALELASKYGREVTCFLDSELVVNQLLGKYKVANEGLTKIFKEVQKKQDKFDSVKYVYVSRENVWQKKVDKLLNKELDRSIKNTKL